MLIDNATLQEVSSNPILYLPSRELIEMRKKTDSAKLDVDVWRGLYDRALNAETVINKIVSCFKNDYIMENREWQEVAHLLKDHNLLLNGGAAAVMSLLFSIEYYVSGSSPGMFDQAFFGEEVKKYKFDEAVVEDMREVFDKVTNPSTQQSYTSAFTFVALQIFPETQPLIVAETRSPVTLSAMATAGSQGCPHGGEHDALLEQARQKIAFGRRALSGIEKISAPHAGAPTVDGSVDPLVFEPLFVAQLKGLEEQFSLLEGIADRSEGEEEVLMELMNVMQLMKAYLNKYIS